ncbi:MAG: hypothetical protein GX299_08020 [Epulopiscium sp.]|jgi:hypothetical protein|nr:hypothetical protein [Candidatus Epulonipiscium sp.]
MDISHSVGFLDFVLINGRMWFCNIFTGSIISLNLETNEFFYEVNTDINSINSKTQYGSVELVGNELYFVPRNATQIFVFNIKDKSTRFIELEAINDTYTKPLFLSVCKKNADLYLIPGRYPSLVRLDTKTKEVRYESIVDRKPNELLGSNAVLVGDELIIGRSDRKSCLIFDLSTGEQHTYSLEHEELVPLTALAIRDKVMFAGFGNKIAVFDIRQKEIHWIDEYCDSIIPKEGIGQLLCYDNQIFAVSMNQPVIYEVSLESNCINKWVEFEWGNGKNSVFDSFTKCDVIGAKVIEEKMVLYSTVRNSIIEINMKTKEIKYHDEFIWDAKSRQGYVNEYLSNNQFMIEGEITLKDFIDSLKD